MGEATGKKLDLASKKPNLKTKVDLEGESGAAMQMKRQGGGGAAEAAIKGGLGIKTTRQWIRSQKRRKELEKTLD